MKALVMNSNYISFFEDIDNSLDENFSDINIEFQIAGYVALAFAGLESQRETKDVDALKTETLQSSKNKKIMYFLEENFGKKSPGLYRHGMYLDFVPINIIWLPSNPTFITIKEMKSLSISRLSPIDVCISKLFSYSKSKAIRSNDKSDVINCLENKIISLDELIVQIDKTLPLYETHAEAPTVFPKVLGLLKNELIPTYGPNIQIGYELPNWMENM